MAEAEDVLLSKQINVTMDERQPAPRTGSYFQERAARADIAKALGILAHAGKGNPPIDGDELPK